MSEQPAIRSGAAHIDDTVRGLERELGARSRRRWVRRLLALVLVAAVAGLAWLGKRFWEPPPASLYEVQPIERRTITESVVATGAAKPVTEVQVGAQVSGLVVDTFADFNSPVKKGQLLATIDPKLHEARVHEDEAALGAARAALESSRANVATARLDNERVVRLAAEGIASQAEVERARGALAVAESSVASSEAVIRQAEARLASARTTLGYTRIYSPVDGVVVKRTVEPGQTVAASFATPTLFLIAQDLTRMQVLADIDEADVGKLAEGMKARVTVEAFPEDTFEGVVSQVRYAADEKQGVVTYSAVIDVPNPGLKLRSGMTATVTIVTAELKDALAVRNAALRFQPEPEDAEAKAKANGGHSAKKDEAGGAASSAAQASGSVALQPGMGRVFRVTGAPPDELLEPTVVSIGLTDGIWTALRTDELPAGTEVVVGQIGESKRRGKRVF